MFQGILCIFLFATSALTFAEVTAPGGGTPSAVSTNAPTVVDQCLAKRTIPDGQWVFKNRFETSRCRKRIFGQIRHGSLRRYQVRTNQGQIEVKIRLFFEYKGRDENRAQTEAKMPYIMQCVRDFYARQGIKLEMEYKTDSVWPVWLEADHSINLWDEFPRPNSGNWAIKFTGHNTPSDVSCSVAAHELGHLLSLDDRYVDPDCPDRSKGKYGPFDSLMARGSSGTDNVKLYPEDIVDIIAPLCGGPAS